MFLRLYIIDYYYLRESENVCQKLRKEIRHHLNRVSSDEIMDNKEARMYFDLTMNQDVSLYSIIKKRLESA